MSAPTYPWVISARWSRSTSSSSGILREWIFRIWRRSPASHAIVISRSKRPAAKGRVDEFRHVRCADDHDFPRETRPSISARSCARRASPRLDDSGPFGARASISSKKMMLGEFFRASSKTCRSLASLSRRTCE